MRRIDKLIVFLAVLAFAACESTAPEHDGGQPEPPTPEGTPISLQSGLMPMAEESGDHLQNLISALSLKSKFDEGESVGFFARMNNREEDIRNLQLTLKGKSFDSEVLADINAITQFFAYYPYQNDNIYSEQGVSIYKDGKDGEVIDFLTTDYAGNGASLAGNNFFHTFAVVCIRCGDGFSHFDGDIYVQLQKMVKAVRINWDNRTEGDAFGMVDLVYDNDATSKEQRRFTTTQFTAADGKTSYWAAIIPCKPMHSYVPNEATIGGVTVESIVLSEGETETEIPVDNAQAFKATITENGNSQGETTGLRGGSIYHLELRKVGFEASVFPCKVEKWSEGESIQQTLENGIDNKGKFRDFVTEYNRLFDPNTIYTPDQIARQLESSEDIKRFGSEVNGVFTVFLKADIDFADTDFDKDGGVTPVINNLLIPIDGRGHTISNIRMSSGFCKSLRSTIKSLTFNNIRVVQPDDGSDAVGMLADSMEDGGCIEDCHVINGWLEGNGNSKVGAAVGTMNAGTITRSSFAGIMIGKTDTSPESKGLVGVHSGGTIGEDNTNDMVKSTMQMGN